MSRRPKLIPAVDRAKKFGENMCAKMAVYFWVNFVNTDLVSNIFACVLLNTYQIC